MLLSSDQYLALVGPAPSGQTSHCELLESERQRHVNMRRLVPHNTMFKRCSAFFQTGLNMLASVVDVLAKVDETHGQMMLMDVTFCGPIMADRCVRFTLPEDHVVQTGESSFPLENLKDDKSIPESDLNAFNLTYDRDYIRSIRQARALAASVLCDLGQSPIDYAHLIFVWWPLDPRTLGGEWISASEPVECYRGL